MAAMLNNGIKRPLSSEAQSSFSTPFKKRVVELLANVNSNVSFSHLSEGYGKEETDVILDVNSNRKSSKTTFYSGATNLSSPSILSHFSSVNHSKDKPVGYYGNHSIEGHQDQNYHSKDISLTCDQQIEVKPHVSYDTHSILRPHHHSNHSMDNSPDHHSNHSVDKLTSQQDKNSTKNVKGNLNAHTNGFSYYKGIKTQNGINRCDENVLGQQNDSEELKVTSYKGSVNDVEVKMNQETKDGYLHSQGNRCQQIKTFDGTLHQTRTSPVFKSEKIFAVCHLQGDSSPAVESINTGSVITTNNHVYSEDPIGQSHQTSDINGNVTPPCDKNNMTDDKQLPKCNGKKEEKRANVMEIYTCSICEKEFRQSGNFYNHMKSHTESLRYCKCGICGSMFDSGEKLLQHMRKEHTGSNPYKCEHCDREFSQYNNLRRHLRVHQEKKFKCRLCDRTFNEEFYLTMHMGTHTGHRTYSCGVCTAEFTSSSDLKNHVKTHPISELHVCDVCGKGFSKACVLRQHKKAHSGERPYKCEQCNKTFIHRHHLTMHMRSHTESKPFTCETCGKEFSQTSHLYKHIRQHLVEAKLLDSNQDGFKGQDEKQVINTLGNNSIPDKLNGEPSNLQQSVKPKPRRKRSKGPRDKEVSPDLSAPSHYASQFSEALANPFQSSSPSSGMFGPLSNEATQNMMKQMNFPPPDHPTQQNPMYMAYAQASMAAYYNNWYMMNYLSHSGKGLGTDYAQDLSLPKRNPFSYESPMPLSHTRDSSPTVNSARNTPISSIPIHKEYNHYFHNSTIPRPVEFLNSNVPVSVNGPFDLSLPTTQRRSKYGSIGENDVEDLSSRGSHRSSSPYATSSVSSQPDTLSHSRESSPVDHLKSASHSIMKPPREEDESELNLHPLEQLGMITTQSNSRRLPLHPLSSSIHNVHKIKNTESKFDKPMRISVHTNSFPDDRSNQQQRKRLRKETHYSSNMDLELRQEIMLNDPDLSKSKAVEDRKLENCRKIKVKDEKVDELKEEANAEEEQHVGENASQPEEFSSLKQQIEEVREMIQHEIQKETIDGMTDSGEEEEEEEEEEGRLMIVEQDTEIQTHDSNTSDEKKAELEKGHFVVSQNEKIFSHGKQHDWKRNTFRRDTLQRSQLGSVCCNKTDVSGECIHGTYEEEAEQQGSEDLRWVSGVETSWSHSAVKTNGPFDLLRPRATTPIQRAVNNLVSNDSSGTVLDMSMKCSPAENQQIHRKQKGEERLACPACLTPMDTDSNFFKHLAVSMQCYQLYIAKKLREPASSPSEETVLKLAKKYACQEIRDEGIYVSQKALEEPMDLTERASSKIKSRTVEDLSDHNKSLYHVFCKCCKEPMLNEVALSLHLAKNPRCFHIHYLGRSPVSLRKIDNDSSAESGTLRQIMHSPSGRNSEQTTDKDNKAILKSDMIISQTIKGSQPHVPISSQHHPPSWHYNPTMTHYKQSVPSSQPHFYLLQQDALCPVYSGGTIPYEQDHSLPLALVKKEKSSVDPISSSRNGIHVPREEKKGEEIRKTVATSEASFCCGICWKTFTTSSDLEVHQNEHAPLKNGYYTCEFCDSVFSRPSDFQCHMLTHRDAYGMHQYNDKTTEETKSLSNRKSVEQGQPHVNFSDVKNGINDQYKCHVCGEVFEQAKFYRDHMETHTGEKPYRCTVCSRGFTYKHNLNRHLMSHNAKTFSCSVCGRGFKESFYLQMHMKIHAEEKNRRCEICGQHIPKSDLWQHMIAHLGTSDQNPTYDQIGERVKEILKEQKFSGDNISLSAINEHLKKYLPVSEGLGTLDDLMALTAEFKVFQAVKEKEEDGDNAETKLSYVSNSNVISNNDQSRDGCSDAPKSKRSQNKGEQVCPICNYVFKTKREFGNHLGVHNGERTHICKVCGKGFKKSCILRQHEKIHSGDRPFKCEVCGASFLHYHHLQIHSRVHNGDKPYKCHICGMGFKHSSNLPKHLEMHELESRNQSDNQSKEIQDLESSKAEIESVINMTVKHSVEKDRPTMMAENKSLESGINHLEDANEGNVNSEQVRTEESTETQSTARQNAEGEEECQSKRAKSPAPRNGDSIKDALALPKEKIPNSPHSQMPCDSSIGKPYSSPETRNQA